MSPGLPADLAAAVALGGEMGRRFAEFDWAAHPLGPPDRWSPEARATVAVALTSRFPIMLFLNSQDLFLIYNDAAISILGDRHPGSLGGPAQEVWWDIWEQVGPMFASVVATGEATWFDDLLVTFIVRARPQERYFTFSYSPLIDNDGETSGGSCAVAETTERVLSERRLHLLNAFASAVMETRSIDDAVNVAVAVCASHPADLPFIAVYVDDPETGKATLRGATPSVLPLLPTDLAALTDSDPASRSRAGVRLIDESGGCHSAYRRGLGGRLPRAGPGPAAGRNARPLGADGGTSPLRPLDPQYRGFCQLLADQLSSALASAVSYEKERQRADALAELDRAKTAFLTNVSHEFRTPLTLLLGPLDDALSEAAPDSVLADRLSTAGRNARRLQRLVELLLDFSRIEAGRANAKLVCIDVGALTSHIASSFTELCHRARTRPRAGLRPGAGRHRSGDVGDDRSQPAFQCGQIHSAEARFRSRWAPNPSIAESWCATPELGSPART